MSSLEFGSRGLVNIGFAVSDVHRHPQKTDVPLLPLIRSRTDVNGHRPITPKPRPWHSPHMSPSAIIPRGLCFLGGNIFWGNEDAAPFFVGETGDRIYWWQWQLLSTNHCMCTVHTVFCDCPHFHFLPLSTTPDSPARAIIWPCEDETPPLPAPKPGFLHVPLPGTDSHHVIRALGRTGLGLPGARGHFRFRRHLLAALRRPGSRTKVPEMTPLSGH